MSAESLMPLPINSSTGAEHFTESIGRLASRLSGTQVASASSHAVPNWIGEAADAYTDEIVKLRGCVDRLINVIPPVKKAVTAWGESVHRAATITVPQLHDEYDTATSSYHSQKDELRAMREEIDSGIYYAELSAIEEHYNSRVSDIVSRYKRAMNELDTEAHDTAVKIRAAIDAYISPEVVKRGRDAIGASLFDGMPLVDAQAEWEFAQKEAIEAAALLGDGTATPEKVREFHEKYGDMCKDPFFSKALLEKVPPEKLMRFSITMDLFRGRVVVDGKVDREFDRILDDTVKHLGNVFVLSTGGMNLEAGGQGQARFELVKMALTGRDGASIDLLTKKYVEQWKVVGNTFYDTVGNPYGDTSIRGSSSAHYGYEYLGAMLNRVAEDNENLALGPAFLEGKESLAHDMLRWDHETLGDLGQPFGYGNWERSAFGNYYEQLDPISGLLKLMDQPVALIDGSINLESLESSPGLKELINDRFDAVQHFLTSDTTFVVDPNGMPKRNSSLFVLPEEPMSVTRYLTGFRNTDVYPASGDQGETLGRVLAQGAAVGSNPPPDAPDGSAEYERWKNRHKRSTAIALGFLEGYQDGLDIDWEEQRGENYFGMRNSGLRSWAGEILAPHIDDLADAIGTPENQETGLLSRRRGDWDLTIDADLRDRLISRGGFFTDIALDKAAVNDAGTPDSHQDDFYERGRMSAADRLLGAAQNAYRNEVGAAHLSGDPDEMKNVLQRWGSVLNPLLVAPEEAADIHLQAINERNVRIHELAKAGISIIGVKDAISKVPGGVVLTEALDYAEEPALEALLPTDLSNSQGIALGHKTAELLMGDGYIAALSDDPHFLQNYPAVRNVWRHVALEDGLSVPVWVEDPNVPMPRIEEMAPEERRLFRSFVTEDSKLQRQFKNASGSAPDQAQQDQDEANQILGKDSESNCK